MSGCSMPVIINSGSGNQGMTVSLPVIEYARELGVSDEKLYRALIVSNLTAIHQKTGIGRFSAYCDAVSAAITYLYGGQYEDVSRTIVNTIANVGCTKEGSRKNYATYEIKEYDFAIFEFHCRMFIAKHIGNY